MHPLAEKIERLLRDQELLCPGERIVVGVSAGPDSMALLHLLAGLAWQPALQITALYVDHGLRPAETEAEAALVKAAANRLGVGFELVALDVAAEAARCKKSLEHMARDLRYEAFIRLAKRLGATRIAVAHTADDQAEEVIIRLLRGAGRGGLAGMRLLREECIVRPLLTTAKHDILAYLQSADIPFLQDSSNTDLRFLRNQVRLEILPFLERYNPGLRRTLQRNAAILQDEEDLLSRQARRCWQEVARVSGTPPDQSARITIDGRRLLALHPALQRRVAEMMLIAMTARPDSRHIEQFLHLARQGQGGAQLHFSRGLRVRKQRGVLICSYPRGLGAGRGNLE